ncbi:unnamed protein product, partial [Urochloa humidicola]
SFPLTSLSFSSNQLWFPIPPFSLVLSSKLIFSLSQAQRRGQVGSGGGGTREHAPVETTCAVWRGAGADAARRAAATRWRHVGGSAGRTRPGGGAREVRRGGRGSTGGRGLVAVRGRASDNGPVAGGPARARRPTGGGVARSRRHQRAGGATRLRPRRRAGGAARPRRLRLRLQRRADVYFFSI